MPQGQQEKQYVVNFVMQEAKVLLFDQLQVGHNRKMVTQFSRDP